MSEFEHPSQDHIDRVPVTIDQDRLFVWNGNLFQIPEHQETMAGGGRKESVRMHCGRIWSYMGALHELPKIVVDACNLYANSNGNGLTAPDFLNRMLGNDSRIV